MLDKKHVAFPGRLVIVGFGSIGQGVLPLLLRHLEIAAERITIITAEPRGHDVAAEYGIRFIEAALTRSNYRALLEPQLGNDDFLLNVSVDVSSVALIELCQEKGALYLDTCIEPWPGGYTDPTLPPSARSNYALRESALALRARYPRGPTAVLTHGANPGLVSHFVKQALIDLSRNTGLQDAVPASRAHWVDIGGSRVGFGSVETTEIYQEGLQFRSLKIYEAGKRNETLWQIIHDNVRFADAALGDLRAQIAACQLGNRRYGELLTRYGRDAVADAIASIWDNTEREARAVVAKVPDGTYEAESFLDNDGRTLDVKLRIKVKVVIDGCRMVVDFSGMHDQVPGPTNSGYSGGLAAARVAFKCLTLPHAPVNEGCFRPLEIILPEGKLLNAKPPAALGLWSIPLPTVIDTILKALAPALPDRIPAAHKGDMGGCSFSGFRPDGRRFLLMNIFGGGWGGRPREDGESASVSICQGDVRNAPVELQEIQYPFLIERFALRARPRKSDLRLRVAQLVALDKTPGLFDVPQA